MALFSWISNLTSKKKDDIESISIPRSYDGSKDIETNNSVGDAIFNQSGFDIDHIPTDEYELIQKYREVAIHPLVEDAIEEIVNESIVIEKDKPIVNVDLSETELSENLRKKINEEFKYILRVMKFKSRGYGYFRKWYIDGRIYFEKLVDEKNKSLVGVNEIDPLKIKLIREYKSKNTEKGYKIYSTKDIDEYYLYSDTGFITDYNKELLKIPKDAIASASSDLLSYDGKTILSYLHKVIKPLNHLSYVESALVITRITRAPEKLAFYISTRGLPSGKAEQQLAKVMNRYRNKIQYDPTTGAITNKKKFQAITENYWIPRTSNNDGTEIQSIQGSQNLGDVDDIEILQGNLFTSLKVPKSRFETQSQFNFGKSNEITRDEVRFYKFINKCKSSFSKIFDELLETQLLLKKIITKEEWDGIVEDIRYNYNTDNFFAELKDLDILENQIELFGRVQQNGLISNGYFTREMVHKDIFRRSDEDIEELKKKVEEEKKEYPEEDKDSGGGFGRF